MGLPPPILTNTSLSMDIDGFNDIKQRVITLSATVAHAVRLIKLVLGQIPAKRRK